MPPPDIDELPDEFGPEKKTDECDLIRKIKKDLLEYQHGRMFLSMVIGLKKLCLNVQFEGFSDRIDKGLPPFYTCKSVSNFTDILGPETRHILNSEKGDPNLFDRCFDGMYFPIIGLKFCFR